MTALLELPLFLQSISGKGEVRGGGGGEGGANFEGEGWGR